MKIILISLLWACALVCLILAFRRGEFGSNTDGLYLYPGGVGMIGGTVLSVDVALIFAYQGIG